MLHVHIGKDADAVGTDFLAEAEERFGDAVEHTLVGQAAADEDVDADELGSRGGGDGHGADPVVAEQVDAERAGKEFAGLAGEGGEAGDGGRSGGGGGEGGVPEVLHDDGVGTAFFQGEEVAAHGLANGFQVTSVAGCTGERGEMNNAQQTSGR